MRNAAPHQRDRAVGVSWINSGVNDLATPRQPERPEVVTHVLGTFCYLCVGAGQSAIGGEGGIAAQLSEPLLVRPRQPCVPILRPEVDWIFALPTAPKCTR